MKTSATGDLHPGSPSSVHLTWLPTERVIRDGVAKLNRLELRRQWWIYAAICVAITLALIAFAWKAGEGAIPAVGMFVSVFGALGWLIASRASRAGKRFAEAGQQYVTLDDSGVTMQTSAWAATMTWADFIGTVETDDLILCLFRASHRRAALFLPKTGVPAADVDAARAVLAAHTPAGTGSRTGAGVSPQIRGDGTITYICSPTRAQWRGAVTSKRRTVVLSRWVSGIVAVLAGPAGLILVAGSLLRPGDSELVLGLVLLALAVFSSVWGPGLIRTLVGLTVPVPDHGPISVHLTESGPTFSDATSSMRHSWSEFTSMRTATGFVVCTHRGHGPELCLPLPELPDAAAAVREFVANHVGSGSETAAPEVR